MTAPLGNVKASVPPEQLKAKMNPGDVSFLGFERKDNVFTVTFAWITSGLSSPIMRMAQ